MNTNCLEKVVEYASMPLHGTLSRKLRKGLKVQINEGRIYEKAVLIKNNDERIIKEVKAGRLVMPYYSTRGQEIIPSAVSVS